MKVIDDGFIVVKVYSNESIQRHHLPHFHIYWPGGSTVMTLPTLEIIVGNDPPKRAWQLVRDNLEKICDSWNLLNPEWAI
ncbi:MAG: DUF4160 domain-containing protein [Bellilinea sp.]